MANHSGGQHQRGCSAAGQTGASAFSEPEVRRWPHPVNPAAPAHPPGAEKQPEAGLSHIHCALSYQNQLLADIKALLEELVIEAGPEEK